MKAMVDDTSVGGYQDLRIKYYEARAEYTKAKRDFDDYINANPGYDVNSQDYKDVYVPMNEAHIALYGTEYNSTVKVQTGAVEAFSEKIKEKVALEEKNAVSVADAVAIGSNAQAKTAGAVALGSNSVVGSKDRAGTESKLTGYDERTGTGYNGRSSTDPAWRSTAASVSVGGGLTTYTNYKGELVKDVVVTRRISNVAAGVYDTDAVNVAQLKRAATINSDDRNVAISMNDDGEMLLNSPYINVDGVKEVSNALAITSYGSKEKYKEALEKKKAALEPKLGYKDASGNDVAGSFDQQIESLQKDIDALKGKANKEGVNATLKAGYEALIAEATEEMEDLKKRKTDAQTALKEVNALLENPDGDYENAEKVVAKQSQAYGTDSVAIGKGTVVGEKNSTSKGKQSVAIGNSNTVLTDNTFVLGNNVKNTVADSVFLGNNTAYVPSGTTTKGIEKGYKSAEVNGVTFDNFAGGDEVVGVVSVGNEKETRRIQNVAPGLVTKDSTDTVNGSQLWAVADKVTNTSKLTPTKDGTVKVDPTTGGNNFTTAEQVQNAINNSGWKIKAANGQPQLVKAGDTVDLAAGDGVTITQEVTPDGTKFTFAADVKTSDVTDLKNDIANIKTASDLYASKPKAMVQSDNRSATVRKDANDDYQITSPFININGTDIEEGKDKASHWADASGNKAVAVGQDVTVTGNESLGVGSGLTVTGNKSGAIGDPSFVHADNSYSIGNNNYVGDGGNNNFAFGNTVNITGGANNVFVLGNEVTVDNKEASNSVILGSQSAYTGTATRTGGATGTVNQATVNGVTYGGFAAPTANGVVSVGAEGKERRIQNVAAGKISPESTDAINGSQLYSAMSNVNNNVTNLGSQITNVDSRARKGIAGAAALAALHPLEFDPDDKLTFAAGVGNYRGETAAAIGAFYRADEKVMFSIGGSMGNGENVVNAGVSFSLDRTPRKTSSRTAMAREIVELREQVAQLTAIVNQLAGGQLPKPPVMFPNTPENAWAYEYLENLQMKGNIVGYTGRELTRNEFAAALDRAMMSGAKLDERLIKEFEPELSHVRVSHVAGKGEDEGGWYERPRTSHDKLENQHEIAKKPLRPQEKSVTSKS